MDRVHSEKNQARALSAQKKLRYFAFISYSHKDRRWADWLHRALETYRVPHNLRTGNGREPKLPARIFPVFKDREELPSSADLGASINDALNSSDYLIVICSPHSAKSRWVDEEIRTFKALGREDRVLCLVVDGEPNVTDLSGASSDECFPEAIRYRVDSKKQILVERTEPIAADVRSGKDGRAVARLKLIAGILGISFDSLRQRDQVRRMRRMQLVAASSLVLVGILATLSAGLYQARNTAEKARVEEQTARIAERDARKVAEARLTETYRQLGLAANLAGDDQRALLYLNAVRDRVGDDPATRMALADSWLRIAPLILHRDGNETATADIMFSSNNKALLTQDMSGELRRVDLDTSAVTQFASANVSIPGSAIAPRAARIVTFHQRTDDNDVDRVTRSVEVLDHAGVLLASFPWPNQLPKPKQLTLSANGKQVLVVVDDLQSKNLVQIWHIDSITASIQQYNLGKSAGNFRFYLAGDGHHIAVTQYAGSDGFWLEIRDTETLKSLGRVDLPTRPETVMFLSSKEVTDKKVSVVVGLRNGLLQRYELVSGLPLVWSVESNGDSVSELAHTPSGNRILAAGPLGYVSEYDELSGAIIWRAPERFKDILHAVAYSPTGALGLVLGSSVLVASRQSNQSTSDNLLEQFSAVWTGPHGTSIRFSKDGRHLAVGSEDGTLRAWHIKSQPASPTARAIEMPADESSFSTVTSLEPGRYLLKGQNFHIFEAGERASLKVAENGAMPFALSADNKVIARSKWGSVNIFRLENGKAIQTAELQVDGQSAIVTAIQSTGAVAIVAAIPGGGIATFGTDGQALRNAIAGDGSSGNPVSVWAHQQGRYAAASFNDSSVIVGMLGSNGIDKTRRVIVPGAPASIVAGTAELLLLENATGFWLLDIDSGKLSSVSNIVASAATILTLAGKAHVAIVSAQGELSLLNMEGETVAQARPVQPIGGKPLLSGAGDRVGGQIAVHPGNSTSNGLVATSLNEHVYLWQLPDLRLVWRSPPIGRSGLGQDKLNVVGFDASGTRVLIAADSSFGLSGVFELTIPTQLPSREEVQRFLSNVARLKLDSTGRVVRR